MQRLLQQVLKLAWDVHSRRQDAVENVADKTSSGKGESAKKEIRKMEEHALGTFHHDETIRKARGDVDSDEEEEDQDEESVHGDIDEAGGEKKKAAAGSMKGSKQEPEKKKDKRDMTKRERSKILKEVRLWSPEGHGKSVTSVRDHHLEQGRRY